MWNQHGRLQSCGTGKSPNWDHCIVHIPGTPALSTGGRVPTNQLHPASLGSPDSFDFVPGEPVYARVKYMQRVAGASSANTTPPPATAPGMRKSTPAPAGWVAAASSSTTSCLNRRALPGDRQAAWTSASSSGTRTERRSGSPWKSAPNPIRTRFRYALSRPWLRPYTGPVKDFTSNHTTRGDNTSTTREETRSGSGLAARPARFLPASARSPQPSR